MVTVGQKAPDFFAPALVDDRGQVIELVAEIDAHDLVVLLFAPADFVPACTAEWRAVRDAGWHDRSDVAVFGLTGDSLFSHAAYADREGIPFPIISDFHGGIAEQYDLYLPEWEGHDHIPGRAVVAIEGDWTVRAVETGSPLAELSPAPVERVTSTLADDVFDLSTPTVEYDH